MAAVNAVCTQGQARAAYREWSKVGYLGIALGSDAVGSAVERMDATFMRVLNNRTSDKSQPRALIHRISKQSIHLQTLMHDELARR